MSISWTVLSKLCLCTKQSDLSKITNQTLCFEYFSVGCFINVMLSPKAENSFFFLCRMHCTVDWLILVLNTISSELFLNSVGCKTTHTLFIKSRAWSSWCCGQASFHLFHSIHSLNHSFIVLFKYLFIYLFSGWDWCQLPAAPVFADVWSHPPIDFFGKRPFVYVFRNCIIPSDHLPISHTSNGCMSKHFMNTQKHFISSIPLCSFFSSSHE